MGIREDAFDLLACDGDAVRTRFNEFVSRHGVTSDRGRAGTEVAADADRGDRDDLPALTERDRRLIDRVRLLDTAPIGVTLCGPAYRDTPILYANRTFRDRTGYSLAELRGRNPRLLQGPRTDPAAVAKLREAVSIWEAVTVDVWNHRRDGTPFLNRVSLRPLRGDDGTITHWAAVQAAVQAAVEGPTERIGDAER
ncbi:PAS domain-containing protein [Halorubrum lipolyticum]|uniref:PAS/PAC domain-containing protein n=1 Tax=Halorubrum lipolyticum DSM 21995 TaxID=1227482 RepID=M0NWX4_9EURY|nr:PAS domain-containing protein [Halorubrum lipolyticum]EMA62452.1 PAS/PAC domain-containing protein [Halorubrum lipolyticum DSM 21995]